MRILYLSQYFPPEVGATQTRAYEMAQGLIRAGHQVTVITEVPNHPSGIIPPEYKGKLYERSDLDGIDVVRVWVKTSPVKNFRTRMAFYLSYMVMAALAGLVLARGRYDAIYVTSPPLFVGGAALMVSYLRRIPMAFEVRDLWPESAVALGELNNPRAIAMASWLEKRCYQRASVIVVVTQGIFDRLQERGYPADKLALILNGANTDLFTAQPEAGQAWCEAMGLSGKFVVIYAGIHGIAQGLDSVLDAAEQLAGHADIHFLFVGEGPVKAEIVALAHKKNLRNVTFQGEVPRQQMPSLLSAANVALVPLRRLELFKGALPSKMFDAMACQRPVILSAEGEAGQVLEQAGAGVVIPPEDPAALAATILELHRNPELCLEYGRRGRVAVENCFSRQAQARQLVDLLETIGSR
ncbi:MAG TPA: glycosyltransferase family 4 protein [Anaerolineae bacterium]|nr:glycosyltransferase family 4 protein [Anaerolineae bacterium]